jgi:hypothetical protein
VIGTQQGGSPKSEVAAEYLSVFREPGFRHSRDKRQNTPHQKYRNRETRRSVEEHFGISHFRIRDLEKTEFLES